MTKEDKKKIICDACEKLELVGRGMAAADHMPDGDKTKAVGIELLNEVREQALSDIFAVLGLEDLTEVEA